MTSHSGNLRTKVALEDLSEKWLNNTTTGVCRLNALHSEPKNYGNNILLLKEIFSKKVLFSDIVIASVNEKKLKSEEYKTTA